MATSQNTGSGGITPPGSVPNVYPELPEVPFQRTSIDMPSVVAFALSIIGTYGLEPVRTTYCIFRNESGNGQSGVNNNYAGIQADNRRWTGLTGAVATSVQVDNAGDKRRFICFAPADGYKISFEFTCKKVRERNMFIGAPGVNNTDDLVQTYFDKWVANPKEFTDEARADFKSMYNSAIKNIPQTAAHATPPSPSAGDIIKAIQTKLGIAASGIADADTLGAVYTKLFGPSAETADAETLINEIQENLGLPVSGIADNMTLAAINERLA